MLKITSNVEVVSGTSAVISCNWLKVLRVLAIGDESLVSKLNNETPTLPFSSKQAGSYVKPASEFKLQPSAPP